MLEQKKDTKPIDFSFLKNMPLREKSEIESYEKQQAEMQRKAFLENCGLDSDFYGAKIDFNEYTAETRRNLWQFVDNVRNKKGGFLIINGTVGTGKTSAAAAVMVELMKGTYLDMLELDLKLNTADRFNSQENREMLMHRLIRCELLVLDEVGRFPDRKLLEQPILFYLLNRRFQNNRPTVVCTNMSSKEFADFMGQALIDRIRSNRIRVELNGSSLR